MSAVARARTSTAVLETYARAGAMVSRVTIEPDQDCDRVTVWNRGKRAGTLTVLIGEGCEFAERLLDESMEGARQSMSLALEVIERQVALNAQAGSSALESAARRLEAIAAQIDERVPGGEVAAAAHYRQAAQIVRGT